MITRRTKMQLLVFVLITLLGVTYVGGKYARLDRLFYDSSYTVTGHFAEAGGIYAGAEVSWRGVTVGQVDELVATRDGVDVRMSIDNGHDRIPADTLAVVANRSALGEQFVDLQPRTADGPWLKDGSQIAVGDTRTPLATAKLLADVSRTVSSVPQDTLRTVVNELGIAFKDTGDDLGQIIDTSNAFINTANANFDMTTALIRDARIVLDGQLAKANAIRSFSRDLALFSGVLAGNDAQLRTLIERGGATATVLRQFLEQHGVEISSLLNNLVTVGRIVSYHLPSIETILVAYPYAVEGGYTVAFKGEGGHYVAAFGLVFTQNPSVCHKGYESADHRPPTDTGNRPMPMNVHCAEGLPKNARGAQWAPARRAPVGESAPIATYDQATGDLTWNDQQAAVGGAPDSAGYAPYVAPPATLGNDSWKWLYLQPLGR